MPNPLQDDKAMLAIVRDFYALRLPNTSDYPANGEALQSALLTQIVENEVFASNPPAKNFQIQFWKRTISHLEGCGDLEEVDSRIYDVLLALLSQGNNAPGQHARGPPPPSFLTHFWRLPGSDELVTTTILESRTMIEAGTTGLHTWGASLALCQHLQEHPELVRGKRVLELGCGSGLLGIVVARLGAEKTILTDGSQEVLDRCRDNVQRAQNVPYGSAVRFALLDWTDSLIDDTSRAMAERVREWDPQIVLCADVVYAPEIIPPLAETLCTILTSGAVVDSVLLALTVRRHDTFEAFISALDSIGLQADVHDLETDLDGDFMCTASETDRSSSVRLLHIPTFGQ
ncbi:S-adenosyl-L-methionine-dependent methyltransferase [Auricularia subglabra TFB-10046 SS5]|nr:S-adenosyl-L-methionine-dependent methyltransferase [Auricularia subglabra TFB-10046 SS5]